MQFRMPLRLIVVAFVFFTFQITFHSKLSAQDQDVIYAPADTSSPRATLKTFIDATNKIYEIIKSKHFVDRSSTKHGPLARRLLDCLDLSEIPEYARDYRGEESAACLKEIIDRVNIPDYDQIPGNDEIEQAGGMEKLSKWRIPGTRITIGRIGKGPRKHEYLFTSGTVKRAPEYFRDMKHLPYRTNEPKVARGLHRWYFSTPGLASVAFVVDRLPGWCRDRILGLAFWQWIGLAITVLVAILLAVLCYKLQVKLSNRWKATSLPGYWLVVIFPIVVTLIPSGVTYVVQWVITVRGLPYYVIDFGAGIVTLLAACVLVFAFSNRIAATIIASPQVNPEGLDAQFIRILSKLIGLVIVIIIFLQGGNYLGLPMTALLASAGVGGVALALASQDTLKNLFGTIMLLSDKPYRVGERIVFKDYDGVVEDIGLRSTKIRLLSGNLAVIPNEEIARSDIENVGRRKYIRRVANIHIPLDTAREKVEKAIAVIRSTLENHEGMVPEKPPRVYFNDFNPTSFNIRIFYWFTPPNIWDYMEFSEKINLTIFRAFEEQGIPFSLPFRVSYWAKDYEQQPLELKMIGDEEPSLVGAKSNGRGNGANAK